MTRAFIVAVWFAAGAAQAQSGVLPCTYNCPVTPIPPAANSGGQGCDRCNFWPYDLQRGACPANQHMECATQPSFPRLPACPTVTWGVCVPNAIDVNVRANYYPLFVVYAPPGKSSVVTYSNGDLVGTTVSATQSWKNDLDIKAGVSSHFIVAGGSIQGELQMIQSGDSIHSVDQSIILTSAYTKKGESDTVDHDQDEIWFFGGPALSLSVSAPTSWPTDDPATASWGLPQQNFTAYYMLVGELNGNLPIHQDVWDALNYFGIGPSDFAQLLGMDPFASYPPSPIPKPARPIRIANPTSPPPNPALDTTRFAEVANIPYKPVSHPTDTPSTQQKSITRQSTTKDTTDVSASVAVGVEIDLSGNAIFVGGFLKVSDKFTFTQSESTVDYSTTTVTDTLVLAQPGYNYTGGTVLHVYQDKIYGTFAFDLRSY